MSEQEARLIAFAQRVLLILERDKDWSGDTLEAISNAAHADKLARTTRAGNFKRGTP